MKNLFFYKTTYTCHEYTCVFMWLSFPRFIISERHIRLHGSGRHLWHITLERKQLKWSEPLYSWELSSPRRRTTLHEACFHPSLYSLLIFGCFTQMLASVLLKGSTVRDYPGTASSPTATGSGPNQIMYYNVVSKGQSLASYERRECNLCTAKFPARYISFVRSLLSGGQLKAWRGFILCQVILPACKTHFATALY